MSIRSLQRDDSDDRDNDATTVTGFFEALVVLFVLSDAMHPREQLSVTVLREKLKELGQSSSGKKADLGTASCFSIHISFDAFFLGFHCSCAPRIRKAKGKEGES